MNCEACRSLRKGTVRKSCSTNPEDSEKQKTLCHQKRQLPLCGDLPFVEKKLVQQKEGQDEEIENDVAGAEMTRSLESVQRSQQEQVKRTETETGSEHGRE